MNKLEFTQRLAHKNFDDTTIDLLYKATQDVVRVFGHYITEKTIIERIENNLDHNVEFVDDLDLSTGKFFILEKKIEIKKGTENFYNNVFVHEFLHMITLKSDYDRNYVGVSDECSGKGVNEALTEILAQAIDGKTSTGYVQLTQLMKLFLKVFPESGKLINAFFDVDQEKFMHILEENNIESPVEFIQSFDDFLDLYKDQLQRKDDKNNLLSGIVAKNNILNILLSLRKKAQTLQDLEEKIHLKEEVDAICSDFYRMSKEEKLLCAIFGDIKGKYKQLIFTNSNYEYLNTFCEDIESLLKGGVPQKEIMSLLEEHNMSLSVFDSFKNKEDILKKSKDELIAYLEKKPTWYENCFSKDVEFNMEMYGRLFHGFGENELDVVNAVVNGYYIAKKNKPEIDFDELKVVILEDECTKIGLLTREDEILTAIDMGSSIITNCVSKEIPIKNINKSEYELQSDGGKIKINKDFSKCSRENNSKENDLEIFVKESNIDFLEERVENIKRQIDKLVEYGSPESFLNHSKNELKEIITELDETKKRIKLKRENIKTDSSEEGR